MIYPCVLVLHHGYKWFKHRYLNRSMKKQLKEGIVAQDDLPNFFAALPMESRLALIREEVQNMRRHQFSKMSKEALYELVSQPIAPEDKQIKGDLSYRPLWHRFLSEELNYRLANKPGRIETGWIISEHKSTEHKKCSLDVVNLAVNLAYIPKERAEELELKDEYFIRKFDENAYEESVSEDSSNSEIEEMAYEGSDKEFDELSDAGVPKRNMDIQVDVIDTEED